MINDLAEKIALGLYGRSARASIDMQHCVKCGGDASIFMDKNSRDEYMISGYCQPCQDEIFSGVNEDA